MYPAAPRIDLTEMLHGVAVADPFRILEDADNPDTTAWVEAENALTRRVLDTPLRRSLVARLRALHRVPRASVAAVRGSLLFFTFTDGTRNQPVLRANDRVVDLAGRVDEPAGRAKRDDEQGGAGRIGAVYGAFDVLGRDWMDDAVELRSVHNRRCPARGAGHARNDEQDYSRSE